MEKQIEIIGCKIDFPIKKEMLFKSPEEKVRHEYIDRLINYYGFNINQIEQDAKIKDVKNNRILAKADIVVWRSFEERKNKSTPLIVVECKAEQVTIKAEDYFKGTEFARLSHASFFVTTNQKQTRIFSKIFKIDIADNISELTEIKDIPHANNANDDKVVNGLLGQTVEFARDEFSRLLLKCHNIIRNNDKLSPEAAFDEISKILFIKTLKERENNEGQVFLLEDYKKEKKIYDKNKVESDLPFYKKLFQRVKEQWANDDLFELSETIRIRENSFEDILKELESYNLSTTSDDIKGIAFEKFLGKTFRGELGQFFTPRTIVEYMIEILDPQEGEIICDPCCGSGGFLIKAFEYVRDKIEESIKLTKEKIKQKYFDKEYYAMDEEGQKEITQIINDQFKKLNAEFDSENPLSRFYKLSRSYFFGTDANPRMARTAKMNMIMQGDGHGGVHHHDGLINVNGIYNNKFDIILTNPPFGSRVDKSLRITNQDIPSNDKIKLYKSLYGEEYQKNIDDLTEWANYDNGKNKPKGRSVLSLFDMGNMSSLTEVLFIERCLNLLKPGGRMAIVLPEGVLNNPKLQKVRDYVESKAKIINITSIPQDVFIASGAMVKPSLLFFKKFTEKEAEDYYRIKTKATNAITDKYKKELDSIEKKLKSRGIDKGSKKELKEKYSQFLQKIEDEIKLEIKENFDYEIPIVEVEKAGISSTGAPIENELKPVAVEFKKYRTIHKLWEPHSMKIKYDVFNGKFQRVLGNEKPQIFYKDDAIDN